MRARDRRARLYPERSTTAMRWKPASRSGRVAVRGKLQREGKRAVESSGATRGAVLQAGGGSGMAQSGGRCCCAGGRKKAERQAGGRRSWTGLQFSKIPGTLL